MSSRLKTWKIEAEHEAELRSLYGDNPLRLKSLWDELPEALRADANTKTTFALAFLRLADADSAKAVDPSSFGVSDEQLPGARVSHLVARVLIRLYLKKLKVFYYPLAMLFNLWCRNLTDAQLMLNMYLRVWSNNSVGLRYILPLFSREILRKPDPDSHRSICFFGYLCALNSILDDGILLVEQEIARFGRYEGQHPYSFWIQDIYLLLAMLYFYNMEYAKAEALHAKVERLSVGEQSFLFVRTMNYGTWLRLAALQNSESEFETISEKLRIILQSDYDKRFALRTHSYRALIAARQGKPDVSLQNLALANAISDKNPWGLEYCNHFGVAAKIYLYQGFPDKALETSLRYIESLKKTSFQTSFIWEANLLALKCVLASHLFSPGVLINERALAGVESEVARNLRPYRGLSKGWRQLYGEVRRLLRLARLRKFDDVCAKVARLAEVFPGQFDEINAMLALQAERQQRGSRIERSTDQATAAIRFNREILDYTKHLKDTPLNEISSQLVLEFGRPIFRTIFAAYESNLAKSPRSDEGQHVLSQGIMESPEGAGFTLTVEFETDNAPTMGPVEFRGYTESLAFRRDLLASLTLWKEVTDHAVREKQLHLNELEQEKNVAIVKTTQMLAHDVRRPFSLLNTMLSLLQQGVDKETVMKFQSEVRVAINSVNGMIADIMEIGSQRKGSFALGASLRRSVNSALIQNLAQFKRADINFHYQFESTELLAIDESRLIRVIANIVANAVQAMKGQGEIGFASRTVDGGIQFSIRNSNSYIPTEVRGRIFESFFTHGKRDGTGLGLAIVSKIVSDCGGTISCDSSPLEGTTFLLTLPRVPNRLDSVSFKLPAHSKDVLLSGGQHTSDDAGVGSGLSAEMQFGADIPADGLTDGLLRQLAAASAPLRVLVCDDEAIYATALRTNLATILQKTTNLVFESCNFAEDALRLSQEQSFDLFILDVDLVGSHVSGFELCQELRAIHPNAVICIHSNRGELEFQADALRSGAQVFLPKPMHRQQLIKMLCTVMESRPRKESVLC